MKIGKKEMHLYKIPEYLLAVVFLVFVFLTAYHSLKNYWEIRVEGTLETADGYSLENGFEENFNILLWNKEKYVEYYGLAANILKQPELNEVIKLKNNYLTSVKEQYPREDLQTSADNLLELQQYLENMGSELLYVQTPYKISKYDTQLPIGVTDYSNENLDMFIGMLEQNGVNYIDVREEMYEDGLNQYDYFYVTDHHWTPEAGFYTFKKIAEYLDNDLNIPIHDIVTNLDNYRIDNYPEWHLGSNGQRTGKYFGGIDDFHLITPDFPTAILNLNTNQAGTYEEILIEDAVLEQPSRAVYDIAYSYSLGNNFYTPNTANHARIIFVSDSMGKVVAPFMVIGYENVFTTSYTLTEQMILDYQPDVVIFLPYHDNVESKHFDIIQ